MVLGQGLDATSIAEALWLADTPSPAGVDWSTAADTSSRKHNAEPPVGQPQPPRDNARPYVPDDAPIATLRADTAGMPVPGKEVRIQGGSGLPRSLDLARSLRPFKRRWPHGRSLRLDIDATVSS